MLGKSTEKLDLHFANALSSTSNQKKKRDLKAGVMTIDENFVFYERNHKNLVKEGIEMSSK